MLLMAGGRDGVTPLRLARRMHKLLRGIAASREDLQLHEVATKGHEMLSGESEVRVVMEFLARHFEPPPCALERDPSLLRVKVG
eukprot:CAMPEP_0183370278 /NCGR_PEP_ID=MMETSP0164_2-20130417/101935_1 /TAXON_ID=221442 /ORGANISM="Coccolithus pelagicus ssp braarudi, Strain PLY182g" /LENGTH=83 /DNA_ID=CAMNT_0025546641 /DNA_START=1 /DNA_END=249 /DNA_ORIENTATION=-